MYVIEIYSPIGVGLISNMDMCWWYLCKWTYLTHSSSSSRISSSKSLLLAGWASAQRVFLCMPVMLMVASRQVLGADPVTGPVPSACRLREDSDLQEGPGEADVACVWKRNAMRCGGDVEDAEQREWGERSWPLCMWMGHALAAMAPAFCPSLECKTASIGDRYKCSGFQCSFSKGKLEWGKL